MPRTVSRVALGARGTELTVITLTAERRESGMRHPVVVVTANVHGDECVGVGAVLRLLTLLEGRMTRGVVYLYPTVNPEGLERRMRRLPDEDQDLNRQFPGDRDGSAAERYAHALWTDLGTRHPDLLIDLHSDAPASIPYVLLDRAVALRGAARNQIEQEAHQLATASGLTVLHEYPDERYSRYRLDRSLTGAVLNRMHVPAVTVEAGPKMYLDEAAVDAATNAVLSMLYASGMIADRPEAHPTRVSDGVWRRDSGPRASHPGILQSRVGPGQSFKRGDVLAEVRSLSGGLIEELTAESRGFVVSLAERTHVVAGVPVCTVGLPEER